MKNVLVTADHDEAAALLDKEKGLAESVLHLPLEQYEFHVPEAEAVQLVSRLDQISFVLYGSKRNSRFFLQWSIQSGVIGNMKERIHLVTTPGQAALLEESGIPAICPAEAARPIDLMEFLLRISVKGVALCPVTAGEPEEIPALLEELGMDHLVLPVCKEALLESNQLTTLRRQLENESPDRILFHSRRSVIRTQTAFPGLNLESCRLLAASEGVAHRLREAGLEPARVASGTWRSVSELLSDEIN